MLFFFFSEQIMHGSLFSYGPNYGDSARTQMDDNYISVYLQGNLLNFFPDRSYGNLYVSGSLHSTVFLYCTYPDELTNDPSFRVHQK